MSDTIFWLLAQAALAVLAGGLIGFRRGRLWEGLILAFFFGWIGVIITALLPKTEERKIAEAAERLRVEQAAWWRALNAGMPGQADAAQRIQAARAVPPPAQSIDDFLAGETSG